MNKITWMRSNRYYWIGFLNILLNEDCTRRKLADFVIVEMPDDSYMLYRRVNDYGLTTFVSESASLEAAKRSAEAFTKVEEK